MSKRDWYGVVVIGLLVGFLVQPIVGNIVLQPTVPLRVGLFFGFLVLAPLALWVAHLVGRFVPVLYQFAKFAAVGSLNTFVDLGVLNVEIALFGRADGFAFTLFRTVSFFIASTNSYVWNKYWTFQAKEPTTAKETTLFYGVTVVGFVINVGLASLVVNVLSRPHAISPILWANIGAVSGIVISLVTNFLGYKFLVFRQQ